MQPVTKAVTLAAGRGTRMQGLTEDCPKPMLPLGDRPMLAHQIERLEQAGVREVLIIVGYKAEMVKDYFAQHPPALAKLSYVIQEKQDGTGSAAMLARDFAAGDPFLMTYGDNIVEPEVYAGLLAAAEGAEMALSVKHVDDPYQGGAVYTEGERVTKIVEKPPKGTSTTNWNNAGIYVFRPSIFEALDRIELSPRGEYELTDAVHALVNSGRPVKWYEIRGFWRDIGRPEDLPEAEKYLAGS
ncbi:MAG: NTP transferase domain-containing protein [Bryobacterales bacterium]|nr:NTP transferase domain-containing protein [Acidobacteriota bacterium]MCB9384240.1 NTP transferase domain-containing protein [Bryobacterales bacterium]